MKIVLKLLALEGVYYLVKRKRKRPLVMKKFDRNINSCEDVNKKCRYVSLGTECGRRAGKTEIVLSL